MLLNDSWPGGPVLLVTNSPAVSRPIRAFVSPTLRLEVARRSPRGPAMAGGRASLLHVPPHATRVSPRQHQLGLPRNVRGREGRTGGVDEVERCAVPRRHAPGHRPPGARGPARGHGRLLRGARQGEATPAGHPRQRVVSQAMGDGSRRESAAVPRGRGGEMRMIDRSHVIPPPAAPRERESAPSLPRTPGRSRTAVPTPRACGTGREIRR